MSVLKAFKEIIGRKIHQVRLSTITILGIVCAPHGGSQKGNHLDLGLYLPWSPWVRWAFGLSHLTIPASSHETFLSSIHEKSHINPPMSSVLVNCVISDVKWLHRKLRCMFLLCCLHAIQRFLHQPGWERWFSAHVNTLLTTFLCPYNTSNCTDECFLHQVSWGRLH